MPQTSDLSMDGLSGYLWLFVAVCGTISLTVDSTYSFITFRPEGWKNHAFKALVGHLPVQHYY